MSLIIVAGLIQRIGDNAQDAAAKMGALAEAMQQTSSVAAEVEQQVTNIVARVREMREEIEGEMGSGDGGEGPGMTPWDFREDVENARRRRLL